MKEILVAELENIPVPGRLHAVCMRGKEAGRRQKLRRRYGKIAAAAAAVICVCMLPAAARQMYGYFADIKDGSAITGQAIEEADNDFALSAVYDENGLQVRAELGNMDEKAYGYVEELSTEEITLIDASGNIVMLDAAACAFDGTTGVFVIETEVLEAGEYTVRINGMQGLSKADAPLEIRGSWECTLTVE